MKMFNRSNKSRGFTLVEVMITLGIFGAALAVVLYYQQRATTVAKATDTTKALTTLVSKIKTYYGNANSYDGVTAASVSRMGISPTPLVPTAGTGVADPWGNSMDFFGGPTSFIVAAGGSSNIDVEACNAIASSFATNATAIYVGTGFTTTLGVLGGTTGTSLGLYKTPTSIDPAELAKGCAVPNAQIALQFK
jgi:prepilin-type N-terminal cleavage/methylation domain-containing protein